MKLRIQPVKSGANIFDFAVAVVVFTMAESGAAEVKAQYGKTKPVQCLHRVEYNLVVQRPSKQRMRMADYRCMSGVLGARIQQRFQSSGWALEKERLDG